ncbi:hypothetical protein B566_EDAN013597 [Ephemera danica]|nr:hypothetical protein B566_EDAN013597 [Ephemera danica]
MNNKKSPLKYEEVVHCRVIDVYLRRFHEQLSAEDKRDSCIFPSDFYTRLVEANVHVVANNPKHCSEKDRRIVKTLLESIKNIDVFDKNSIFMPIFDEGHWYLAIIRGLKNFLTNTEGDNIQFMFFNSLKSREFNQEALKPLLTSFLEFLHSCRKRIKCNLDPITETWPIIPQQKSSHYSLYYMLQCIKSYFSHPIDEQENLENWFSRDDVVLIVKSLKKYAIQEPKNMHIQPKVDMSTRNKLVPGTAIRCQHCGYTSHYLTSCEKCMRPHIEPHITCPSRDFDAERDSSKVKPDLSRQDQKISDQGKTMNGHKSKSDPSLQEELHTSRTKKKPAQTKNSTIVSSQVPSSPSSPPAAGSTSSRSSIHEDEPADMFARSQSAEPTSQNTEPDNSEVPTTSEKEDSPAMSAVVHPSPVKTRSKRKQTTGEKSERGVVIHVSDYLCLRPGEMLNDSVIEFYLRYLQRDIMSEVDKNRTHIFSSYFYQSLTKIPVNHPDPSDIVYSNVKNWTKGIDIFKKDFIVVPVNRALHWILAIICFPGLESCEPMNEDGTDVSPQSEVPIKQPCIIIFDSMRPHVWTNEIAEQLSSYLTFEYKARKTCTRDFSKILTIHPEVPQQSNAVDCGVFILQYAKSFFQNPIKDFKENLSLSKWFSMRDVRGMRKEITSVILREMAKTNSSLLPNLPTFFPGDQEKTESRKTDVKPSTPVGGNKKKLNGIQQKKKSMNFSQKVASLSLKKLRENGVGKNAQPSSAKSIESKKKSLPGTDSATKPCKPSNSSKSDTELRSPGAASTETPSKLKYRIFKSKSDPTHQSANNYAKVIVAEVCLLPQKSRTTSKTSSSLSSIPFTQKKENKSWFESTPQQIESDENDDDDDDDDDDEPANKARKIEMEESSSVSGQELKKCSDNENRKRLSTSKVATEKSATNDSESDSLTDEEVIFKRPKKSNVSVENQKQNLQESMGYALKADSARGVRKKISEAKKSEAHGSPSSAENFRLEMKKRLSKTLKQEEPECEDVIFERKSRNTNKVSPRKQVVCSEEQSSDDFAPNITYRRGKKLKKMKSLQESEPDDFILTETPKSTLKEDIRKRSEKFLKSLDSSQMSKESKEANNKKINNSLSFKQCIEESPDDSETDEEVADASLICTPQSDKEGKAPKGKSSSKQCVEESNSESDESETEEKAADSIPMYSESDNDEETKKEQSSSKQCIEESNSESDESETEEKASDSTPMYSESDNDEETKKEQKYSPTQVSH